MGTPTPTTAPAKKSNTMLYAAIIILVIIVAAVAAYLAFFQGGSTFTPTVTFHLSGDATKGWNGTTPGPAISIKHTDKVLFVLTSADGGTHNFVIGYDGKPHNPAPANTNFISATFSSNLNVQLTASQYSTGTFQYYCQFHDAVMYGTITVT